MRSEQPGFVLLGDAPSEYQADLLPDGEVRGKFFRGFFAGAILSALAIAAVFFLYGHNISDAAAQLLGTGTKPASENVQTAAAQPAPPPPNLPPAPSVATPPSVAPANPQAAADTAAANTTTADATAPPATVPGRQQPPVAADPAAVPPAVKNSSRRTSESTEPIPSASKTPASRNREPAPVAASEDTGEQELAIAQRYLRNGGASADSAAAALLWSAVKKGNIPAEVTLAELYARGEGVTRSCEQARVLLYAAAGKGSDEADQQLAQIARGGCK